VSPHVNAGRTTVGGAIETAEILSIGTELTVGDTRDTNAGELARSLSERGVEVGRLVALPDSRAVMRSAFVDALARADLVVSTGGLGPTPDDLTREAISDVCGETPAVDPDLETWLRGLWERRNLPFVDANLKQAWLIPSAVPISNPNGTAPGWWVDRPDGRVIVALPGPPREMHPMWHDWVLPRLAERGLGRELDVRTLRTTGIGESMVVDRLGSAFMDQANPRVTTYARQDAVDIRIAARPDDPLRNGHRSAQAIADEAEDFIATRLGEYIWGRATDTWVDAIDRALATAGWRLATLEQGTSGALAALLAGSSSLARAVISADDTRGSEPSAGLEALADDVRQSASVDVGVALTARHRGDDTAVTVAVVTPAGSHRETRVVFLGGAQGRQRAAVTAAAILHTTVTRLSVADTATSAGVDALPTAATRASR
jgi:nicotinamide-nucleotide amidase